MNFVDDLVVIVMELLRSNQELETKVAALNPGIASGSLRDRIVKTFRRCSGLRDTMEGDYN
jgi:hypothetical protein